MSVKCEPGLRSTLGPFRSASGSVSGTAERDLCSQSGTSPDRDDSRGDHHLVEVQREALWSLWLGFPGDAWVLIVDCDDLGMDEREGVLTAVQQGLQRPAGR